MQLKDFNEQKNDSFDVIQPKKQLHPTDTQTYKETCIRYNTY